MGKAKTKFEPISAEQEALLIRLAKEFGRSYKSKIQAAWLNGNYGRLYLDYSEASLLQQLRNNQGPEWLAKYQLPE